MNKKFTINDIRVINNNNYQNTLKLKKKKNDIIIKVLIVIIFLLIIILAFKLFIFNNKNKFLKQTTIIYNNILENLENINNEFMILNNENISINSDININYLNGTSSIYNVSYIENGNAMFKVVKDNKEEINNTYQNQNIFTPNNYNDIKYIFNMSKKALYKSLDINMFEKSITSNGYKINLKLNDNEVKRVLRHILQKIKLNNNSIELIKRYTRLNKKNINNYINDILNNIDSSKFEDLSIDIYYHNNAYKIKIIYGYYTITYNIKTNNLIVNKDNEKLLDINIKENNIESNSDSTIKLNYDYTINNKQSILNFSLQNEKSNNNNFGLTLIYDIVKEEDIYNYKINCSVISNVKNIDSFGISSNMEIKKLK